MNYRKNSNRDTTPSDRPPSSPRIPYNILTQVDGTEEIDLPLVIAKRVQAKEPDVEHTVRHRKSSLFPRKVSGDTSGMPMSMRQRRPSTLDRPRLTSYRSFSGGTITSARQRSASLMSTLQIPLSATEQAHSSDLELGFRPDAHAQADFVAANNSASRISLATPKLSRSQNVSAAQAIYHEVMEEERLALHDRLEEETAEGTKSQGKNSWLTSWMFRRTG